MKRVLPFVGSFVLAVSSFAQQPNAPNPSPGATPYTEGQPVPNNGYSRPVERSSGGGWGLWGLLGLLGLLGARRRETVLTDRNATSDPRRRAA